MSVGTAEWREIRADAVSQPVRTAVGVTFLWVPAMILVAIVLGVRNVPGFGSVVCYLLALHALRGPRQTVESLTLLGFVLLLGGGSVSVERWIVLVAALTRTIWDSAMSGMSTPKFVRPVAIFTLTILVITPFSSIYPLISVLKVASFGIGVGTLFTAVHRTPHLTSYWLSWLLTLAAVILFASFAVYATGGGYEKNSVGFQGVLSHPQTFGPVLAPLAAFLTGMYFIDGKRAPFLGICAVLAWVGMYMSQARTSLLATVLGLFLTVGIAFVLRPDWRMAVGRVFSRWEAVAIAIALVALIAIQWSSFEQKVFGFILKDGRSESVGGILKGSRGNLMDRSMENFRTSPWLGIGFGVPSDASSFDRKYFSGFMGLPTRASVEKGFMPTAVLEETGAVGAFFTVFLLVALLAPIVRRGEFTLFWVASACVLVNFGEMVFFSLGGMGLYFWLVLAICTSASLNGNRRNGAENPRQRFRRPIPSQIAG